MQERDRDRFFATLERLVEAQENLNELVRQGVETLLDTAKTTDPPTGPTGLPAARAGDPVYVFGRHAVAASATMGALEILGALVETGTPIGEEQRARATDLIRTALDLRDDWPPAREEPDHQEGCAVCGTTWPAGSVLAREVDIVGGIGPADHGTLPLCPACRAVIDRSGGFLVWGTTERGGKLRVFAAASS